MLGMKLWRSTQDPWREVLNTETLRMESCFTRSQISVARNFVRMEGVTVSFFFLSLNRFLLTTLSYSHSLTGTCTADYDNDPEIGYSVINREVFQEFIRGKDQIMGAYQSTSTEDCDIVTSTMNRISSLILNIFVQGTQRYLWKTRNAQSSKEAGELFIFATAILPFVDKVDSNCAEKLYNRAWNLDFDDDDWIDIKTCLEDTYAYLGVGEGLGQVTCARVGVLHEANTVSDGSWVPCVDATIIDESSNEKYILYGIGFGLGFLVMVLTTFSAVLYLRLRRHADSAKVYEGERKISMARAELV